MLSITFFSHLLLICRTPHSSLLSVPFWLYFLSPEKAPLSLPTASNTNILQVIYLEFPISLYIISLRHLIYPLPWLHSSFLVISEIHKKGFQNLHQSRPCRSGYAYFHIPLPLASTNGTEEKIKNHMLINQKSFLCHLSLTDLRLPDPISNWTFLFTCPSNTN